MLWSSSKQIKSKGMVSGKLSYISFLPPIIDGSKIPFSSCLWEEMQCGNFWARSIPLST
jgi:hypothetical protein